jgi:hypothetical protein
LANNVLLVAELGVSKHQKRKASAEFVPAIAAAAVTQASF